MINLKDTEYTIKERKALKKSCKFCGITYYRTYQNDKQWSESKFCSNRCCCNNNIGQKHSEETKRKQRENHADFSGSKNPCYGKTGKLNSMFGRRGPLCPSWRGGKTRPRQSRESVEWRLRCLERDNYTCQKTKMRGGDMEVHHIFNFSQYPELRFDISNGITLQKDEHRKFHRIYGNRDNDLNQLLEFIKDETQKSNN